MTALIERQTMPREIVIDHGGFTNLPASETMRGWLELALGDAIGDLYLRFVDERESRQLNSKFRDIDAPTNVLSFPALGDAVLGDIAICVKVLQAEATAQNKSFNAHLAHLIIHGVLHLRGYDHIEDTAANVMEMLEINLLRELGVANPYE